MSTNNSTEKKIIFLWVHPRSLSTAFERCIIQRGDMEIIHEPFGYLYYVHENRKVAFMTVDPNHPTSYEDIKNMILERARTTDKDYVFVKDMAFHCFSHISKDPEFLRKVTHSFIVRHPLKAVASHYAIHPTVTQEEIGHEHQWKLCDSIYNVTGEYPPVIISEDLEVDASGVMEAYTNRIGVPFIPNALRWERSYFSMWDTWKEWHVDVANSTGFYKTDTSKHEEAVAQFPHLQQYVNYHLPFYNKLFKYRVNRQTLAERRECENSN